MEYNFLSGRTITNRINSDQMGVIWWHIINMGKYKIIKKEFYQFAQWYGLILIEIKI